MTPLHLPVVEPGTAAIFLGKHVFCVVDEIDHAFALRWKWKAVRSKGCTKVYAFRTTMKMGRHVAIWLHKEILLRAEGLPPDRESTIGDHLDGNSLNNRRGNLRWTSQTVNFANRRGVALQQLRLASLTGDRSRLISGTRG